MAQTAQGRMYNLSTGYGNDNNHIDELLANIALDINNLQEILNNVGTTSDTISKRHEFNEIRNSVNSKIAKAARKIDLDDIDTNKYQKELQEYTSSLRNIMAKAIKLFQDYNKPHSNRINEHNEKSPLLSSSMQSNKEQQIFSSFATNIKIVDEAKMIEQEEEDMTEIRDSIFEMKQMFENLDHIVNEQEEAVDKLENNVSVIKDHIDAGKGELEIADANRRRSRNNKIVLLIVLIMVLAIIIAFVWAYDRTK